jgi:hypothetical protein
LDTTSGICKKIDIHYVDLLSFNLFSFIWFLTGIERPEESLFGRFAVGRKTYFIEYSRKKYFKEKGKTKQKKSLKFPRERLTFLPTVCFGDLGKISLPIVVQLEARANIC